MRPREGIGEALACSIGVVAGSVSRCRHMSRGTARPARPTPKCVPHNAPGLNARARVLYALTPCGTSWCCSSPQLLKPSHGCAGFGGRVVVYSPGTGGGGEGLVGVRRWHEGRVVGASERRCSTVPVHRINVCGSFWWVGGPHRNGFEALVHCRFSTVGGLGPCVLCAAWPVLAHTSCIRAGPRPQPNMYGIATALRTRSCSGGPCFRATGVFFSSCAHLVHIVCIGAHCGCLGLGGPERLCGWTTACGPDRPGTKRAAAGHRPPSAVCHDGGFESFALARRATDAP